MQQLSELPKENARNPVVYVHAGELKALRTRGKSPELGAAPAYVRSSVRPSYSRQLLRVGLPLWISDLVAATVSYTLVFCLFSLLWPINHFAEFLTASLVALSASMWLAGCYPGIGQAPAKELRKVVRSCIATHVALAIGVLSIRASINPYSLMVVFSVPLLVVLLPLARCFTKDWMHKWNIAIPFYFVGSRQDVKRAHEDMSRFSWTMFNPVGRFSPINRGLETVRIVSNHERKATDWESRFEEEIPNLGTIADLLSQVEGTQVNWLFFVGDPADSRNCAYVERLEQNFPQVVWIVPQSTLAVSPTSVLNCGMAVGIRSEKSILLFGPRIQKRVLDFVLSLCFLVALSPLFLAIALLVRITSRGPILLRNPRIGQDGGVFHAWKFRSMVANADQVLDQHLRDNPSLRKQWDVSHKLKDDPRVTAIGRILRKTSLDEIPQLWNVLLGQMSLVGPRPILVDEVTKYGETYDDYLKVLPGITGLWQVSGRNNTSYPERLAMVRYYVQHWSPWLDLYILLRTVRTVVMCEGAY